MNVIDLHNTCNVLLQTQYMGWLQSAFKKFIEICVATPCFVLQFLAYCEYLKKILVRIWNQKIGSHFIYPV